MAESLTKNEVYPAALPVKQSSWPADGLIQLRERFLNRLSGVQRAPPINAQIRPAVDQPTDQVAAQMKSALANLKAATMDAQGLRVDYDALRSSKAYAAYRDENLAALGQFDPQQLASSATARAFWINLYNALVLDAVINFDIQQSVTEGRLGILSFFRRAAYLVGGQRLSLEDIEHGILRGNRGNPFVPGAHFATADPRLAWALHLDPRLHFALNCGGLSCPPIRTYSGEKLNQQLDLAARAFVDAEVEMHPERNEIVLSQIFRWYTADFGGRSGIITFISRYLPDDDRRRFLLSANDKIRFIYAPYDWQLNTR